MVLEKLGVYRDSRVLAMLMLGFSAGLPFLLVFSTLSAWLAQAQIERATIGMMAWVSLAYTLKFFWAPFVDRLELPLLTRLLGRRRSWMLLAQIMILIGLALIGQATPQGHLGLFAALALLVAFSSATQDIVVDAWRIESVPEALLGAMAAAYQLGYRVAIVVAGAGALWLAATYSWQLAYWTMASLMLVGVLTTLFIREPVHVTKTVVGQATQGLGGWLVDAVVGPFTEFLRRFGWRQAAFILGFVGLYRLTDFTMGVMANPFYLDAGYSLKEIAAVAKGLGVFTQILGVLIGGVAVAHLGMRASLQLGIGLVVLTNLGFFTLAQVADPGLVGLGLVISADNLAMGVSGTALIAYLSSLTHPDYTATQYALFSSFFSLPGKVAMGFSGFVVDSISWPGFFLYTTLLGVPALIMVFFLSRINPRTEQPQTHG